MTMYYFCKKFHQSFRPLRWKYKHYHIITSSYYHIILVFLGGGLGAVLRYAISQMTASWSTRFPWATFLSNILACLILGAVMAAFMKGNITERYRLLLATGLCGGFSTFSTFTAETWNLWQKNDWSAFSLTIMVNLFGCWLFFLLGMMLVKLTT